MIKTTFEESPFNGLIEKLISLINNENNIRYSPKNSLRVCLCAPFPLQSGCDASQSLPLIHGLALNNVVTLNGFTLCHFPTPTDAQEFSLSFKIHDQYLIEK